MPSPSTSGRWSKTGQRLPPMTSIPCSERPSYGIPRSASGGGTVRGSLQSASGGLYTLSRVSREMSKRMLCVFSIWKVKSLQFQLMTTQKKRKLGDNLFTEEAEEEEPSARDTEPYLDKLQTLMFAYAMAGVGPLPMPGPGFDPKDELTLGADSTLYAQVPLDVATQYYTSVPSDLRMPYHRVSGWPGCRHVTRKRGLNGPPASARVHTRWALLSKRSTQRGMPIGFLLRRWNRPF